MKHIKEILNDDLYKLEVEAYKGAVTRLRSRLRNCQLNAKLKHLLSLIRKLNTEFPAGLFGDNVIQKTQELEKVLRNFVALVDKILHKTLFVYSLSQAYLKVGHLAHHWIVVRASIARLRVYFKALLIYAADISADQQMVPILKIHNCKPRFKLECDSHQDQREGEEIGQLIDRRTYRAQTSAPRD